MVVCVCVGGGGGERGWVAGWLGGWLWGAQQPGRWLLVAGRWHPAAAGLVQQPGRTCSVSPRPPQLRSALMPVSGRQKGSA